MDHVHKGDAKSAVNHFARMRPHRKKLPDPVNRFYKREFEGGYRAAFVLLETIDRNL